MLDFIQQNAGSIAVGAMLLIVIAMIVLNMLHDKRAGKSSCGGDCAHCRGCGNKKPQK